MQEKVLSKRLIIFTRYQVFYHCNSATWSEDAIWEPEDPYFLLRPGKSNMPPQLVRVPLPSRNFAGLRKYAHLVSGYHGRQLTHQSDALNAFAGALTALGKELNTSFLWGIPESSFDENVIWRTPLHNPSLRRREFPSWSWLGWKASSLPGDVDFPIIIGGHIETTPVVQWHKVTEKGEQKLIGKMKTTFYELPPFNPPTCPDIPSTHFLRFMAPSASLFVSRQPIEGGTDFTNYGCEWYAVGVVKPTGELSNLARISLYSKWRDVQPNYLEFIIICWRRMENMWKPGEELEGGDLMLIETTEGVSSRVQLTKDIVNRDLWLEAKPEWRLVTLG